MTSRNTVSFECTDGYEVRIEDMVFCNSIQKGEKCGTLSELHPRCTRRSCIHSRDGVSICTTTRRSIVSRPKRQEDVFPFFLLRSIFTPISPSFSRLLQFLRSFRSVYTDFPFSTLPYLRFFIFVLFTSSPFLLFSTNYTFLLFSLLCYSGLSFFVFTLLSIVTRFYFSLLKFINFSALLSVIIFQIIWRTLSQRSLLIYFLDVFSIYFTEYSSFLYCYSFYYFTLVYYIFHVFMFELFFLSSGFLLLCFSFHHVTVFLYFFLVLFFFVYSISLSQFFNLSFHSFLSPTYFVI